MTRSYQSKPCIPCAKKKYQVDAAPKKEFHKVTSEWGRPRTLADGSIVIPKKGWEPPPPIEGWERDPGNAWRFIKKWPDCTMRQQIIVNKPCGATDVKQVCKCLDCPLLNSDVKITQCERCEYRKPA